MKGDVFHAYDPTSMRESTLGVRMQRSPEATNHFEQASSPQIGYKPPFSSDLVRFSARMNGRNGDISGKATPCRVCPQYGHAIIFSRKCYYGAQCPIPFILSRISRSTDGENHATVEVPPEIEGPSSSSPVAVQGQRVEVQGTLAGLTRLHPGRGTDNISEEKDARRTLLWAFSVDTIQHGEKAVKPTSLYLRIGNHPTQNFLRRLSSTLSKRIAFNDPTKVRINGVWRKKA